MWFKGQGSQFWVWDIVFGAYKGTSRISHRPSPMTLGFMGLGLWFGSQGLGFRVWVFGDWNCGVGFEVRYLGFRVKCLGQGHGRGGGWGLMSEVPLPGSC